ncbi:proline iminopeptidase-family hydrolase [Sediminibacterium sp.]|uniref:proline iminopeptidase-family hydrolase n=1 Tax=Sediminibacterium sp. TaxID=1917865 RepID=UPI0027342F8E|nr:proline iminopeptidase-family hydrolase [Sediminibacterium sp.]MDP3393143.1 proline iminopeptidase-family hydrolase [Sediminibacterium sp.]MDP3567745.1 proline iminopeptidase-family hydrolase [Sediminibacterium sp.]
MTRKILLSFIILIQFSITAFAQLKEGEGKVSVQGGKIWYRIIGKGKGIPILMLHGGPGGTSRSFYQFESIGNDRPIIIFDQLGSGRSDYHTDTSLLKVPLFVEQVSALVSSLQLNSFYLHGHSWGTALALEYYLQYPKGVKAIIFNSPYFSTKLWKKDADVLIKTLPDSIQIAIAEAEKTGNFNSAAYTNANTVYAKNFGVRNTRLSSDLDTIMAAGNGFIYNYMWGPTEFTATGTLINYDRISSLPKIKVPALFITGEFDEARPQTVRYFSSLVKNSQFGIIEGAGHGTMHDNKAKNIQLIKDFIATVEQTKK